ncbi:transposase [Nonomuraea solani]|uniref:transposase n=1 Tax=Nonomuraea solani TaxID=1144553 RepID=UPI000CDE599C|nr:transposase [Nonomuraea solani]
MTRRRRQFSPEFKDEAIRIVLEGDRTVASVGREFDINASTLDSWVNRHRIATAQDERPPVSGLDRARIRELERENAELREKLIFLKIGRLLRGRASAEGPAGRGASTPWPLARRV